MIASIQIMKTTPMQHTIQTECVEIEYRWLSDRKWTRKHLMTEKGFDARTRGVPRKMTHLLVVSNGQPYLNYFVTNLYSSHKCLLFVSHRIRLNCLRILVICQFAWHVFSQVHSMFVEMEAAPSKPKSAILVCEVFSLFRMALMKKKRCNW